MLYYIDDFVTDMRAGLPKLNEPIAGKNNVTYRRRRETGPAAEGKRRYVIDYFVIVDFDIYNRCNKSHLFIYLFLMPNVLNSRASAVTLVKRLPICVSNS